MLSRLKFDIKPLVNEMLDRLPADVWTRTDATFLDPAMAGGQFIVEICNRLLKAGHSWDNIESRVFGLADSPLSLNFTKNKYKIRGQFSVGGVETMEQWATMGKKFDVVIGNPPYEDPTNAGVKLYRKFIDVSAKLLQANGKLAYVTPNTWLGWSDGTLQQVRENGVSIQFVDARSTHINTNYFANVSSTFCWFVLSNSPQQQPCAVRYDNEIVDVDINTVGFIPVEGYLAVDDVKSAISIFTKVMSNTNTLGVTLATAGGHGTRIKHVPHATPTETIPCYCTTVDDKHLHYVATPVTHHDTKKVLVVSSYFNNPNVRRARYVSTPCSNMNNIAYVPVATDSEGASVEEFFNSKLFRFVVGMMTSKRDIPIPLLKNMPVPNTSGATLYAHFNLTQEEIDLIEATVK